MKISLITCAYNSAETLVDTIDSVRQQSISNLEYIIVDGDSKDYTKDVIRENEDVISKWISEPDKGIYDAMNKGIALATGDVIGFLHSDDLFYDAQVLASVQEAFESGSFDAVYGDLLYVDKEDTSKVIRNWKSQAYEDKLFYKGWMPAHPTFYLKASAYKEHGNYDTSFRISADYELMMRMLLKHKVPSFYIEKTLIRMRVGGESNASLSNRWKANQEDARAWRINGLKPNALTRWQKPLSKISQFFS